jgi:ABC-type ATPase with predicted acetyltransferase domain
MREHGHDSECECLDLAAMTTPPATPLVDCFGEETPLREILLLLARVGLGEAWSYLRSAEELSEGQRFRLKLALALHSATRRSPDGRRRVILICDEFAAVLDRITAMVVARCLRRAIDANPMLAAVVATSHEDLQPALKPDTIAWCDFGRVEVREMGK